MFCGEAKYMWAIIIKTADEDCSHAGPAGPPPIFIYHFNSDDSHSAQLREQLPLLANRFRINLNKNGVIGMPFVLPCDSSMPFYWESMLSLWKSTLPLSESMNLHIVRTAYFSDRKVCFPYGKYEFPIERYGSFAKARFSPGET